MYLVLLMQANLPPGEDSLTCHGRHPSCDVDRSIVHGTARFAHRTRLCLNKVALYVANSQYFTRMQPGD